MKALRIKLLTAYFSTSKPPSPYKILQVQTNATPQQIKAKYYQLAQKYHPDHDPAFTQKFKSINQAYQTLKDSQKRRELDYQLLNKKQTNSKFDFSKTQQHTYGYTINKQQLGRQQIQMMKRRASAFSNKPGYSNPSPGAYFDLGFNPNNKNDPSRKGGSIRVKQQQQAIKNFLVGGLVLLSLFGVVELIFKVYQFNTQSHKQDEQVLTKSGKKMEIN